MYMDIVHHRTCVYQIGYHIVFCTKYRARVLSGKVAHELERILYAIAKEYGFEVRHLALGEDHVHVFISAPPHVSISFIVKWVKGITARKIFVKHPELKRKLHRGHLWNPSYYAGTVGEISEETVKRYIESQKSTSKAHS
jgi:putative transposase